MHFDDDSTRLEVGRIREACAELGIDEEMTALILGSHRRDRALYAPTVVEDEGIREYVRRKLTIWVDIFEGPIRPARLPERLEAGHAASRITPGSRGRRASAR